MPEPVLARFGKGKLTGIGGRREADESLEETVVREAVEEVGVVPLEPRRVATLNFFFPHDPSWSQQVGVYITDAWQGTPIETEEIAPIWYDTTRLPFLEMWSDAPHWLPDVLARKTLNADFYFTPELEVEVSTVREELTR